MFVTLRNAADQIVQKSIEAVLPDAAVKRALDEYEFGKGRIILVATGKAGWQMAKAASDVLSDRISSGVVVTKYDHVMGDIPNVQCFEAGHPVPDANSFLGTEAAMELVRGLTKDDTVLFLLSGGGSALFEKPLIEPALLQQLTEELLASGADITEINTIRKRFSAVKGGRFALLCEPAQVYSIILSDILRDPLDMIASGPAYPDPTTSDDAMYIAEKYHLTLTEEMKTLLARETPKELSNVTTTVNGSVRELVKAAANEAKALGFEPVVLTDCLSCEAREAGSFLASIAQSHQDTPHSLAFLAGGETVVHLRGQGKGGRNQELALSAALHLDGCTDTCVFSVGSDGTDGPTDAAGGYVDTETIGSNLSMEQAYAELNENNAYEALKQTGGLIMTGPTGTNVNDFAMVLIRRENTEKELLS